MAITITEFTEDVSQGVAQILAQCSGDGLNGTDIGLSQSYAAASVVSFRNSSSAYTINVAADLGFDGNYAGIGSVSEAAPTTTITPATIARSSNKFRLQTGTLNGQVITVGIRFVR